jgi:uncharacterized protein
MDERVRISVFLDFYGQLLTDKQRDIMDLYYNDDLSLAEISEITNTSRQAIFDILKRCQKLLLDYEKVLKLKEKNEYLISVKNSIIVKLNKLEMSLQDSENLQLVNDIKNELMEKI